MIKDVVFDEHYARKVNAAIDFEVDRRLRQIVPEVTRNNTLYILTLIEELNTSDIKVTPKVVLDLMRERENLEKLYSKRREAVEPEDNNDPPPSNVPPQSRKPSLKIVKN